MESGDGLALGDVGWVESDYGEGRECACKRKDAEGAGRDGYIGGKEKI